MFLADPRHSSSGDVWSACFGRLCLAACLLCFCGCASTGTDARGDAEARGNRVYKVGYLRARWLDCADIVSAGGGLGLGVVGNVTLPLDTTLSVGAARANHYRHANRRSEWRRDWHIGLPVSPIWVLSKDEAPKFEGWNCDTVLRWLMPTGITTHAWKSAGNDIIRSDPPPSEAWEKISRRARVHVGVGAIGYLGLGLNFLEVFDFVLGWTTLDMAGDDSQKY